MKSKGKIQELTPKVIKKPVEEIRVEEKYYPRSLVREDRIKEYAQNIDVLPPITTNQDDILVDGYHRLKAHKLKGIAEIDVIVEYLDEDKILQRAVELNAKHGLQLSYKDKKRIAIEMFNGKNGKQLVQMLSVSTDCLNKWVRDIRKKKEWYFENMIMSEYLKAEQKQDQIADMLSTSVTKVSETKKKFLEKINLLFQKKVKLSDEDKMAFGTIMNFVPFVSDLWELSGKFRDSLGDWPSDISYNDFLIPSDLVYQNLLYYFSDPFDVVYFPFAGNDCNKITEICKSLYRRYFLNNLTSDWGDLEDTRHWAFADGLPPELPSPNFVFVNTKDIEISELNALLLALKDKIKENGYLILFHSPSFNDFITADAGFKLKERIICTYPEEIYSSLEIAKAKGDKSKINLYQFLSIFTR